MKIEEFQESIRDIYLNKDKDRGIFGTFAWFVEEVGELARALRGDGNPEDEFADCAAWLFSMANIVGVDMDKVVKKYKNGCPKCGKTPCICP